MTRKWILWLGVLTLLIQPYAAVAAWTNVGTGIDYQEFTVSGPNHLFVARLDRSETNAFIESSIAQGRLSGGTERVSSQAARYDDAIGYWGQTWGNRNDVIVAINGSYFNTTTGVPESGVIHSGWYAKRFDNVTGMSGFVWDLNRQANIGECVTHVASKQFITYATSNTQKFQGINVAPADGQLTIFTPQYDESTGTDNTVSEVLVELTTPFLIKPTPNYVTGYVRQIRQNQGDTMIPFDHIVLSAKGSAATTMLANVSVGDEIHISQEIKSYERDCSTARSLDWTKAYASVSGNWVFLKDGVIQYGIDESGERHPRTAIALNDSYVFFVVCDGRQSGYSIGMTIDELAEFCKNTLGATWGCNQDGGGSSTMVVNGVVKNSPSDGSERYVANGMLMCNLVSKSQTTTFSANDTVETTTASNLRLGPGTNYGIITTLSSGTQGTVVDHALNGVRAKGYNWWKVDFGTYTGWIAESLLSGGGSCTAPSITQHPSDQTVTEGSTATFTVAASGTEPLSYQWQKDGVDLSDGGDISGATTDTLQIANCETADEGNYRCVVSNACGSATSNAASLTVTSGGGGTEFIVESRAGGQNYANYSEVGSWADASCKSTAEGNTSGIGSRYAVIGSYDRRAIFSFTPSATGTYEVFTTNCTTWNSGNPLIHRVYHAGGSTTVGVCQNADCNPNAVNVWYSLGQYTLNAGVAYTVELDARTSVGSAPSGYAARSDAIKWVSVSTQPEPPTITQDPSDQTVTEGDTATFTVTASGTEPLSYQWQKDGVNLSDGGDISGATTDTLQIANCESSDEGNYRCVVTNDYGSDTSNAASLTVNPQTAIIDDDFDSYASQSEFEAVWSVNVGTVTLTSSRSYSTPNSVYIGTSGGRADRNFTAAYGTDANPLELSFRFYDTSAYNLDRQYVQLYAYSGGNVTQIVCLGTYNSDYAMRDYYAARVPYAPGPNWVVLNDTGAPQRSIGWHELKAVIKSTTIDFYVDGVLAKANVSYAYSVGDHDFSQVRIGSGYSSTSDANYDDMLITGGN